MFNLIPLITWSEGLGFLFASIGFVILAIFGFAVLFLIFWIIFGVE